MSMRLYLFRRSKRLVALLVFVSLAQARPAAGRQSGDLSGLSIEDLMHVHVEPVFGAVNRMQPSTEAPSSVTIVTADDIHRFGYRSLADILRGVRGLYVTYDRNYSYVGARGFSRPGDYNTRILVLVDGHRINDDVFDQAPIGPELGLDPATFERVEIIRGPTSALYGTSAFFAVVNITTCTGADVHGVTAGAEGGSLGAARAYAMLGHRTGRVDAAFTANVESDRGETSLYYPEFADDTPTMGVATDLDRERVRGGTARVSVGSLTLTGAYGWRLKQVPTAAFGTLFGDSRFDTTDERSFADANYERVVQSTRVTLHAYADEYRYDGVYPYHARAEQYGYVNRAIADDQLDDEVDRDRLTTRALRPRRDRAHQVLRRPGDAARRQRVPARPGRFLRAARPSRASRSSSPGSRRSGSTPTATSNASRAARRRVDARRLSSGPARARARQLGKRGRRAPGASGSRAWRTPCAGATRPCAG